MDPIDEIVACGRTMYELKLAVGNSGNISIRCGTDGFYITPSGVSKGKLKREDIVECHLNSEKVSGIMKPSIETGMHRNVYLSRPDLNAVIHSQASYTTLVACSDIRLRCDLFPESIVYLGDVCTVPYFHPGSRELADAVFGAIAKSDVLVLANHGALCAGKSLDEALLRTQTLEMLCEITVFARIGNIDLRYLGEDTAISFKKHLKAHMIDNTT